MRELLTHLDSLGPLSAGGLRRDLGLRLQVSMAIAQLVQLAAEVNAHVLRQTSASAPNDLRSGFDGLASAGWIDPP